MKTLYLLIALTILPVMPAVAEVSGIVVVRHAEKADDGTRDPDLTATGRARAAALADALDQAKVGALVASQYQRTQQTLAVLARQRGLEVKAVAAPPDGVGTHVETIAAMVRESDADGIVVIAGHSNTVPLIVEALSGQVVSPIDEGDYDRMFILLPGKAGMEVISTRYGAESPAKRD